MLLQAGGYSLADTLLQSGTEAGATRSPCSTATIPDVSDAAPAKKRGRNRAPLYYRIQQPIRG